MSEKSEIIGKEDVLLRRRISEIVRPAVLRLPPFDSIRLESCLLKYFKYLDRVSIEKRWELVDAFIRRLEVSAGGNVWSDSSAEDMWKEIDEECRIDDIRNYAPLTLRASEVKHRDLKIVIDGAFERYLPEFSPYKVGANMIGFGKLNGHVGRVAVVFDAGSRLAGHFDVLIGTENPSYLIELSSLCCLKKFVWRYSTAAECASEVEEVIQLLRTILPMFEQKIDDWGRAKSS